MLKLPNSIEPAVMAENIVHLRDGLAAVDAKTLPATTTATTGQILKLTGETKTPAWSDEYQYIPWNYSENETDTGQKYNGMSVYARVFQGDLPEIEQTQNVTAGNVSGIMIMFASSIIITSSGTEYVGSWAYNSVSGNVILTNVAQMFSEGKYVLVFYYIKPTPPGRAPEDSEEPEEKKTTKKKTTK